MRNRKIKITFQSFLNENIDNKKDDVKYLRINLLDKYKQTGQDKEYEEKFNEFKKKVKGFTDSNSELNLKTGDVVSFIAGYHDNIIYTSKILGFDEDGKAFILWDCYWYPKDLSKTMVDENITENQSNSDDTYVKKITIDDDELTLHKVDTNPMKVLFYLNDMEGDSYIDINTILPDNMLIDAVWVKIGGLEEEIADDISDVLTKTDRKTTSGYNQYIMYNIK